MNFFCATCYRTKINWSLTPISLRDLVALEVLVKCGLGQIDRLAGEEQLLALPAVGRAGKLVRTHAVGGLAMGADNVQGFAHTSWLKVGALECKTKVTA